MASLKQMQNSAANSHYFNVVAFAILGMLIGGSLTQWYLTAQGGSSTGSEQVSQIEPLAVVAEPTRLTIESVGIDTTFEGGLRLNPDNTIEVPDSYDELGWYEHGPLPGELGPSVILGHVDSFTGPAVFHPLQNTKRGDIIEIERVDGSRAHFTITRHSYRQQSSFPTEEVYADIDHAGLRLVTCSGTFDQGKQVYSHNLIVFAELLEEFPPGS